MNKTRLLKKRLFSGKLLRDQHILSGVMLILTAALLLFVSTIKPNALQTFRTFTVNIAVPIIDIITSPLKKAQDTLDNVKTTLQLKEDNARLKSENIILKEWYLAAQSLQTENEALRKIVKLTNTPFFTQRDSITAKIIHDTSNDFSKSLLIKAGKKEKIYKNAAVISTNGLVGRVIETSDHTARVLLITDINARIPVIIKTKNTFIHAILTGQNNLPPTLTHIADKTLLEDLKNTPNATITTSGTGEVFPYGIPVGTLDMSPAGKLNIRPYIDTNKIVFVKVLL